MKPVKQKTYVPPAVRPIEIMHEQNMKVKKNQPILKGMK